MKTYIIQIVIALAFISAILAETSASKKLPESPICATDSGQLLECNNGVCKNTTCVCNEGYLTYNNENCNYKQKKKVVAFLLSLLLGSSGADWFYLASGSTTYIIVGVIKLLTGVIGICLPCSAGCTRCVKAEGGKICVFTLVVLAIVIMVMLILYIHFSKLMSNVIF
jgi:hypothetical protein